MRTRPVLRLAALAVLPLLALGPAESAAASRAQPAPAVPQPVRPADYYPTAGYVWSNPADDYYRFNSAGQNITISNPFTGVYYVTFDGLGQVANSAIVQTSPYGIGGTCTVNGWIQSGAHGLFVDVDCYDLTGAIHASEFDLVVTRPAVPPHGAFDYALVDVLGGTHILTGNSYNSAHKRNSVRQLGTGRYEVTFGGPSTRGTQGAVKVSPYGSTSGDCMPAGWHGSRHGEIVTVDCYNAVGAREDRAFTVTYASASNLLGLGNVATANAYASRSTTHSYQPSVQYDSERGARVIVTHLGTGVYEVVFSGSEGNSANGGDVQVTAVSSSDRHCYVNSWSQQRNPHATIVCTSNAGSPANTNFEVNWVVA